MKRLELKEPVDVIDSGALYKIVKNEYPLLYAAMLKTGFSMMGTYLTVKGIYFPQNMPQLSEKLRFIWSELDFICLPPNIDDTNRWSWNYDMLHADLYVEKGSATERTLRERNYPYRIKYGLPVIDGKQAEKSEYFTMWVLETDGEEKRKFLANDANAIAQAERIQQSLNFEREAQRKVLASENASVSIGGQKSAEKKSAKTVETKSTGREKPLTKKRRRRRHVKRPFELPEAPSFRTVILAFLGFLIVAAMLLLAINF